MRIFSFLFTAVFAPLLLAQQAITIDGDFTDWTALPVLATDPAQDEHDTDWFGDGLPQPVARKNSDVDILEVKFTHDQENLYAYVKSRGTVGRTSREADGQKAGRYYFIVTIDVDDNDSTGYALQEGNYWPNSVGYDMNMEIEFYNGAFNTGHYIHHDFMNEAELTAGAADLANHVIRLGPGTYDNYLQWVVFPDSTFIEVSDRGPVVQGIITVAVSADGHEAEMKAPMWGFFHDADGIHIMRLGNTIDVSFSLEGSGELSESAIEAGYTGNRSIWASDTADPIVGYHLTDRWTEVAEAKVAPPVDLRLQQNYPNPFNAETILCYSLDKPSRLRISVVNVKGQVVTRLVDEEKAAGTYKVDWDGRDRFDQALPSGIYWAVMQTETAQQVRRMLLVR